MPKLTKQLESSTRLKINNLLINLGWNLDDNSSECNCYTERARTTEENKKFKGNFPDYVLYSNEFNPIAIIEAKRPGMSLQKALDDAIIKYANPLDISIVFVADGIFIQSYHVKERDYLYYNAEIVTDFLSQQRLMLFVNKGSKVYSENAVTHSKVELIKIFSKANDILRKDGLSEGKERFIEFSNLLFLKLISDIEKQREEMGQERRLEEMYCWDACKDKKAKDLLSYINTVVLPRFDKEYNHTSDIFNKKLLINKATNLKSIIDRINEIGNLLDTNSDVKGDAFEYFLKNSISVGNDLGEYFTPRHIVKIMVELMDLKFGETVYDPCCGTGGFLIEAFKNIKNKCKQDTKNIEYLENETVFGREIATTSRIAKMNMIIIGDGHTNINQMDSLENPIDEIYDVVLTNYAFSQKTDYSSLYDINTEDANPVFLKHCYRALNRNGRAAVVVPEGLLFDTTREYINIRRLLVENSRIEAIIRLHPFVFKPYTGQPTSIIIFKKGQKTDKVWFYDVFEDGFEKTNSKKGRRKIVEDDLITLRQIWREKPTTENSFSVEIDAIRNLNYQLSLNNYRQRNILNQTVPLRSLVKNEKIVIGFTPDRNFDSYWFKGIHTWIKVSDISDNMYISDSEEKITDIATKSSKLLPAGTLLFSFKLSIGKVAITTKPLYTNEAIAGLIVEDELIKQYLYYTLPKLDYNTNRATKGDTLNTDTVGDLEIPFGDRDKIEKIVSELNKIEEERQTLIKAKQAMDKTQNNYILDNIFVE